MLKQIKTASILLGIFIFFTGILYPSLITGISQLIFPHQANGSLIIQNDQVVGSELIGQSFTDPKYFWGRISLTNQFPYNASSSGGSNLGPTNPVLVKQIQERIAELNAVDPNNNTLIPVDLVTASGSGLDPDISIAAAYYQAERVAHVRDISIGSVEKLINKYTTYPTFGFLGEARVNVLKLNLALDALE